eukprot:6196979-Pleurochrysis_carterae.AAC.2
MPTAVASIALNACAYSAAPSLTASLHPSFPSWPLPAKPCRPSHSFTLGTRATSSLRPAQGLAPKCTLSFPPPLSFSAQMRFREAECLLFLDDLGPRFVDEDCQGINSIRPKVAKKYTDGLGEIFGTQTTKRGHF